MMEQDYGLVVQAAAERHLSACMQAEWEAEEADTTASTPAFGPYCGCVTCDVREVLSIAWPMIEKYVRENP